MMNKKLPVFVFPFLFLVICFSLYFKSLGNGFVLDDRFLIVDNLYVQNFSIQKIFTTDVFHFHPQGTGIFSKYYRPFQILSYSFEYLTWKLNPLGYRIDNIILQSLNSFFIFFIIYLIFKNQILALLSGLIFCIHPAHVCLVTFIAGRSNLLEMFFILFSILSFLRYLTGLGRRYYYLSLLLCIGAFLTREGALLLPFYLFICALFMKIDKKKIPILLTPYLLIALLYFGLRNIFMPCDKFAVSSFFHPAEITAFLLNTQEYFWQLVLPLGLKVKLFHINPIVRYIFIICSFLIFVCLFIKALKKKNKIIIFGLTMYFIGLLPIVNLDETIKYFGPLLTEHYVYNASIGFSLLLAYFILRLYSVYRRIAKLALTVICIYFSVLTIAASLHYKDEITFYNYIVSIDKNNVIAHLNLGNAYYVKGMYAQAMEQAGLTLEKEPNSWDCYLLIGNIYMTKGDLVRAIEMYNKTLILNPRSYEAYNNLGLINWQQGKIEAAALNFKRAVDLSPGVAGPLYNLAYMLKIHEAKLKK